MSANNLHKTTRKALWLAIFILSLFIPKQEAHAQWGLVDTVWCGPFGGEGNLYPSPNDSFFVNGAAVWKTIDRSIVYLREDSVREKLQKFINDSVIISFVYIGNNYTVDTVKVYNFKNSKYLGIYNCSLLNIPSQTQRTYNSNLYSKYDNCVYGFGNEDASGRNNKTKKMNLETGEITEVPFLNGLAGGSISPDGELIAGYYFEDYLNEGQYVYDQFFKVISLKNRRGQ